jgi:hypothetical protein
VHFMAPEDRTVVRSAARELQSAGFTVEDIQQRKEPTRGDVRSFHAADASTADEIAAVLEKALAGSGYPLRLERVRPDSAQFRDAPRGRIDVWLPSLSTSLVRQRVAPRY